MAEDTEKPFAREYERLRTRLLDLSRRNPMLNYKHRAGSRRQIRVVHTTLQTALAELLDHQGHPLIVPLPEPDDTPPEEKTPAFLFALNQAKASDIEYLTRLESLDAVARQEDAELDKLERWLRDRIREELGLPARIDPHDISLIDHARRCKINPNYALELGVTGSRSKALQTLLFADDLDARLARISADAKLSEQETGLSTLFLAFGFLRWFDSSASTVPNFAPLLLMPVEIAKSVEKRKIHYRLQAAGEAPETNLTLRELLIRDPPDVPRTLPEFDPDTDNVDTYLDKIRDTIDGIPNWRIERYLTLGHFAFGRLAMYADLEPQNWKNHPLDNKILAPLMRGSEGGAIDFDRLMFAQDYDVDDVEVEDQAPILINNADASQHSAIVDVMQHRNLVIEGPPGTGKSQTITNIIANALYDGKSVLFLADKQAALEVVQTRLTTAGLSDFCLELHSHKAQSGAMVDGLRQRCQLNQPAGANHAWKAELANLRTARTRITEYLNSLHQVTDDGDYNAFQLFWSAIAKRRGLLNEFEAARKLDLKSIWNLDRAGVNDARDFLDIYATTVLGFESQFGRFSDSVWNAAALTLTLETDPLVVGDLLDDVTKLATELDAAVRSEPKGLELNLPTTLLQLKQWIEVIERLPKIERASLLPKVASFPPNEIDDFGKLASERSRLHQNIDHSLLPFNTTTLLSIVREAEELGCQSISPATAVHNLRTATELSARLTEALRIFAPVVSAFPLAAKPTVATALAIAEASKFAGEVPLGLDRYLSFETTGDPTLLSAGSEQLELLNASETQLRTAFDYPAGVEWPELSELELATELSLASPIKTAVSFLAGRRRRASRTLSALNRKYGRASLSAELKTLLDHVRMKEGFLSNTQLIHAVGPFWNGLQTPFAELIAVVNLRAAYDKRLLSLDEANVMLKPRLFTNNSKVIEGLRVYAPSATTFLSAAAEWPDQLSELRLDAVSNYVGAQLRQLQALVDRLRAIDLGSVDLSFDTIGNQTQRRLQLSEINQKLAAHPLRAVIPDELLEGEARCRSIFETAQLVRALASAEIPNVLRDRLVKDTGAEFQKLADSMARRLRPVVTALIQKIERLTEYLNHGVDLEEDDTSTLVSRLSVFLPALPSLTSWCQTSRQRQRVSSFGLEALVSAFEKFQFAPERLAPVFDALLAHRHATNVRANRAPLQTGTGIEIEKRRDQFRDLDRGLQKRQQAALKAKLLQRQPFAGSDQGSKKTWTEMHCLRNEFTKQRHAPIRSIITRAGRSIQALKPCFMMSPLSLAKFLQADTLKFDIMIIDEASQMRPEDSIGALLRADQIVVVGDPKQLPPSDFFARIGVADTTPDDDDDDVNAESILDWCARTYSSPRRLKWHYRSQCESLIAFSNRHFYDNNLITFPTSRPDAFSVNLVSLLGNYRKGRNPAEASRIVETVINFMIDNSRLPPESIPTLGVVAINSEQRELILEEFNRAANHPEVEQYLETCKSATETRGPEGFFVKNLENVQGDERDVIIISLTYGREQGQEHVAQRFGPINRSQGHRRLNVLFTRARKQIVLFSSMRSQDIVVSPSSKRGVRVLRDYLQYAESRRLEAGVATGRDFDSDFEREVCARLRENGFDVDPQVGVGGYRVDLGVRHPDNHSIYLAGIECDGATYHSAKSSRDRDRIRESVLRGLGWRLLRIWSTDWFADAEAQTRAIVRELRALAQEQRPIDKSILVSVKVKDVERAIISTGGRSEDALLKENKVENLGTRPQMNGHGGDQGQHLTTDEVRLALRRLREEVIFVEFPGSEPERSILRDLMIEKIIESALDEPDDFSTKIPLWLRERTDPRQLKYLRDVCAIVDQMS